MTDGEDWLQSARLSHHREPTRTLTAAEHGPRRAGIGLGDDLHTSAVLANTSRLAIAWPAAFKAASLWMHDVAHPPYHDADLSPDATAQRAANRSHRRRHHNP